MNRIEWLSRIKFHSENELNYAICNSQNQRISYKDLFQKANYRAETIKTVQDPVHIIEGVNDISDYIEIVASWIAGKAYAVLPKEMGEKRKTQIRLTITNTTKNLNNCAYIVFTSGSTGEPKGVPIYWNQLGTFIEHYIHHEEIKFEAHYNWLQTYALNFDVSVFVLTIGLATGGTIHLLKNKGVKFANILEAIEEKQINVVSNVPTTAKLSAPYLSEYDLSSVDFSFFSGEALYPNWAIDWMRATYKGKTYNCYGPTETTIVCSEIDLHTLPETYFKNKSPLPIGIPFEGTNFRSENGSLIISGKQVFHGYIDETLSLNDEYNSGDLVSQDRQNYWIFKGRSDEQVQIQGYRVELKEIENTYLNMCSLQTFVYYINNQLIAVIETKDELLASNLKFELKERLPEYMLPTKHYFINPFPLNHNQKADKKAVLEWLEAQLKL